ncbi:hypothetical protein ASG93_10090 [Paenibacillus sp. Soil787]|nr:hypothetical protein ASG93_10090 [Paenibacillus sp. Soil787]
MTSNNQYTKEILIDLMLDERTRENHRIKDIFWFSDNGVPVFISKITEVTRNVRWKVRLHSPFKDDTYVLVFALLEEDKGLVEVDEIGSPDPLSEHGLIAVQSLSATQGFSEYWRHVDGRNPAPESPITIAAFSTSPPIKLTPTANQQIYRRIRSCFWVPDNPDALIILGMKKRDPQIGEWEILLHNSYNKPVSVEVYSIEEEYIGAVSVK